MLQSVSVSGVRVMCDEVFYFITPPYGVEYDGLSWGTDKKAREQLENILMAAWSVTLQVRWLKGEGKKLVVGAISSANDLAAMGLRGATIVTEMNGVEYIFELGIAPQQEMRRRRPVIAGGKEELERIKETIRMSRERRQKRLAARRRGAGGARANQGAQQQQGQAGQGDQGGKPGTPRTGKPSAPRTGQPGATGPSTRRTCQPNTPGRQQTWSAAVQQAEQHATTTGIGLQQAQAEINLRHGDGHGLRAGGRGDCARQESTGLTGGDRCWGKTGRDLLEV